MEQAIGSVDAIAEPAHLVADVSGGRRVLLRAVDFDELAVPNGDRQAAGIRTIERAGACRRPMRVRPAGCCASSVLTGVAITVKYYPLRERSSTRRRSSAGDSAGSTPRVRWRDAPVRVTLIDRHNYHLFQPLLYQVATAALSPGDVASPIRWVLRHQQNVRVLLADARAIDTANKACISIPAAAIGRRRVGTPLRLPDRRDRRRARVLRSSRMGAARAGTENAGRCAGDSPAGAARVRSGGARDRRERAAPAADICDRRRRTDRRRARRRARRDRAAIAAEGFPEHPTGVGAHPAARRQPGDPRRHFRRGSQERARRSLERLGVEVRTNAIVTTVDQDGVKVGEERIAAQTVLWAAGVAASPLVKSLGVPLDRAGRVLAEPTLTIPGRQDVFVAGDVCALQQDGKPLPGVAQVAMQEGTHAARNVAARAPRSAARAVPLHELRQHGGHRSRPPPSPISDR